MPKDGPDCGHQSHPAQRKADCTADQDRSLTERFVGASFVQHEQSKNRQSCG